MKVISTEGISGRASECRRYYVEEKMMHEDNLARTIALIDLCFKLKEAYLRQQHPEASPEKIRDLIDRGILARKERQWALPEICSTP